MDRSAQSEHKVKLIIKARKIFLGNTFSGYSKWKNTHYQYIAPATKEYLFHWLWDTAFHAIVLTHFDVEWAKSEIRTFLIGQWENGFIPHVIFWGSKKFLPPWAYIESRLSPRPHTSALTQPPALALAVEKIYKKDKDKSFLDEVLPKLARHHRWLLANRDSDNDNLISIISPNESGMDELPVFQYVVGYLGQDTARVHYYYRKVDLLNKLYFFNNKTILNKDYFNVEEVLFNCVFIEACWSLSRLFLEIKDQNESSFFAKVAKKAEQSLFNKCWDEKDQIFYSVFSKKKKFAKVKTVASLIPLFLSNLPKDKLDILVTKHLLNPLEFWTNYPIPSVARSEIYYEPTDITLHKMIWRGPTWVNTNWFIIKGLRKHGLNKLADQITEKTLEMINNFGFREYYNPETGQGYRRENFGWSTLIVDLL